MFSLVEQWLYFAIFRRPTCRARRRGYLPLPSPSSLQDHARPQHRTAGQAVAGQQLLRLQAVAAGDASRPIRRGARYGKRATAGLACGDGARRRRRMRRQRAEACRLRSRRVGDVGHMASVAGRGQHPQRACRRAKRPPAKRGIEALQQGAVVALAPGPGIEAGDVGRQGCGARSRHRPVQRTQPFLAVVGLVEHAGQRMQLFHIG